VTTVPVFLQTTLATRVLLIGSKCVFTSVACAATILAGVAFGGANASTTGAAAMGETVAIDLPSEPLARRAGGGLWEMSMFLFLKGPAAACTAATGYFPVS